MCDVQGPEMQVSRVVIFEIVVLKHFKIVQLPSFLEIHLFWAALLGCELVYLLFVN